MTPRKNSVLIPEHDESEPYEHLKAVFLAVLTIFLVILSGIALHALNIYARCGFVAWTIDSIPRCMR